MIKLEPFVIVCFSPKPNMLPNEHQGLTQEVIILDMDV
uniref:Uncharacterized protein n=1 Tax=Rhizophora mucronata TaxID=61149 RepID=A0A2P2MZE2_RHIMU